MIDPLLELDRLSKALDKRAKEVRGHLDWYEGNHPVPDPPANTAAATDPEARAAFVALAKLSVTNLLPPIADAPARKLHPQGFRFSESPNATDSEAWTIWARNGMETDSEILIPTSVQTGSAFLLVWADADGKATISVEDPEQCIVSYAAGSRRERRSALKRWTDDDGYLCATVYTPGAVYKYRQQNKQVDGLTIVGGPSTHGGWVPREVAGEQWPLPNPTGAVPLVEVQVNPGVKARPYGGGTPIFARQINEQRKLNQTVMNALVTMEYQAFRQRWVTGWDYPTLEDGTPDKVAIQKASAARLWTFPADAAAGSGDWAGGGQEIKVGEFAQADFGPFTAMMLTWVKFMAATSGTPPYTFLLGDMINVAADALARIDGIHITNVRSLGRSIGGTLAAEVMRLALAIEGNPKANDPVITTVWGEFEERTGSEQAELAKAAHELGAPDEPVFAMFPGVDAAEAARWAQAKRAQEMFSGAVAGEQGGPASATKEQADALGALVHAGTSFEDAARMVGLPGLVSSGGVPVALRFPEQEAAGLEDR